MIHAVESYYNFTEESTTIKAVLNLVKIYTFYWYITISSINWDQVESPNYKYHGMFMNAAEMTFRIFMHNGNRIYLVCSICKHTSISISTAQIAPGDLPSPLTCLQTSWSSRQIQINIWSQWFFFIQHTSWTFNSLERYDHMIKSDGF